MKHIIKFSLFIDKELFQRNNKFKFVLVVVLSIILFIILFFLSFYGIISYLVAEKLFGVDKTIGGLRYVRQYTINGKINKKGYFKNGERYGYWIDSDFLYSNRYFHFQNHKKSFYLQLI